MSHKTWYLLGLRYPLCKLGHPPCHIDLVDDALNGIRPRISHGRRRCDNNDGAFVGKCGGESGEAIGETRLEISI